MRTNERALPGAKTSRSNSTLHSAPRLNVSLGKWKQSHVSECCLPKATTLGRKVETAEGFINEKGKVRRNPVDNEFRNTW